MFFSREDILKIQKALTELSIKDSEMPEAYTPFNIDDTISIVQKGYNKKISVKEFIDQLQYIKKEDDFVNITDAYDESFITLEEAIQLIPEAKRKKGLVITFQDTNGNWQMYQFRGELNQWNVTGAWKDLYDFEEYMVNSVLPDEEDLTKVLVDSKGNYAAKLKDRAYDPDNFSGLGRVILRKNVQQIGSEEFGYVDKNILSQYDIESPNVVYEVRYDFDLNGQTITVPNNSTLYFNGGSFKNGTLVLQNTFLFGFQEFFKKDLTVQGTVKNTDILSEWWEMPEEDCYKQFKDIIGVSNSSEKPLKFNKREYRLLNDGSTVTIKQSIDFNEATLILNTNGREHFRIFFRKQELKDVNAVDFAAISTALTNKTYTADVFKKYKNTFMYVASSEVEMMREHPLVSSPLRKKEYLYIDANGFLTNTPYNDTISVESGKYFECVSSSYIKNLTLKIEDTFTGSQTAGYRYVGFTLYQTPNFSYENIVMPDPDIENYRLIFFQINECYNVTLRNCNLTNTRNNLSAINSDYSAYAISPDRIINFTFENVQVGNLVSSTVWGATGSNYITNWIIDNSSLGRIDVHHRLNNLTVTNTVIGMGGITYTGFGTILLKNCKAMSNAFLMPRLDYGSYFDGDIILEDCEFINHTKNRTIFGIYIQYSNFDNQCTNSHFKYHGCRNLIIKNLKLPQDKIYNFIPVRTYWSSSKASTSAPIPWKYAHPNISIDNVSKCLFTTDIWKYESLIYDKDYPITINISNMNFPDSSAYSSILCFNILYQFASTYDDCQYYRGTSSECPKYIFNYYNCRNLAAGDYHNNVEYSAVNCHIVYSSGQMRITSGSSTGYFQNQGKYMINNCVFRASPDIYRNSRTLPCMYPEGTSWKISDCTITCMETDDQDTINWMINNQLQLQLTDLPNIKEVKVLDNVRIVKPLSDYVGLPDGTLVYTELEKSFKAFTYPYFSPSANGTTLNVDLEPYLKRGCYSFRLNNKANSTINVTIPSSYYGFIDLIVEFAGGINGSHIYLYKDGKLVTFSPSGFQGDLGQMPSLTRYLIYSRGVDGIGFILSPIRAGLPTTDRPQANEIGTATFDTTLNKPIWWNGTNWVDSTGQTV